MPELTFMDNREKKSIWGNMHHIHANFQEFRDINLRNNGIIWEENDITWNWKFKVQDQCNKRLGIHRVEISAVGD